MSMWPEDPANALLAASNFKNLVVGYGAKGLREVLHAQT